MEQGSSRCIVCGELFKIQNTAGVADDSVGCVRTDNHENLKEFRAVPVSKEEESMRNNSTLHILCQFHCKIILGCGSVAAGK